MNNVLGARTVYYLWSVAVRFMRFQNVSMEKRIGKVTKSIKAGEALGCNKDINGGEL